MDPFAAWKRTLDAWAHALSHPDVPVKSREGLLTRWGALLKATSQRAFVTQSLGGIEWPERYPGMEPPFINIAGALADFEAGRTSPKRSRESPRPALIDTGALRNSISWKVMPPNTLEVGTNLPYARIHQEGGTTTIRISREALSRVYWWLYAKRWRKEGKGREPRKGREGFVKKLWPAAIKAAAGGLTHKIIKRPFLGIPSDTAQDMIRVVEEYYRKETK